MMAAGRTIFRFVSFRPVSSLPYFRVSRWIMAFVCLEVEVEVLKLD
jgi:hypothetical protein